jgi:hypothetical protein
MHQLLSLKIKIGIVVVLAFAISWSATALGLNPPTVGLVVGLTEWVIIFLLFKSWDSLHALPVPLPGWAAVDLNGIWEGEIKSQYEEGGNPVSASIPAFLEVRQSWQAIILSLETASMTGESQCACPSFNPLTRKMTIRYFYETKTTVAEAQKNPPQRNGSAIAEINFNEPDKMTISYTNERGRGGDIVLSRKNRSPIS